MDMGKQAKKLKIAETPVFTCPECGGHELNLIKTAQIWVQPVTIVGTELEYGIHDTMDDPDSDEGSEWYFECRNRNCGFEIQDEYGERIGDTDDLIEWLKNQVIDKD